MAIVRPAALATMIRPSDAYAIRWPFGDQAGSVLRPVPKRLRTFPRASATRICDRLVSIWRAKAT